MSKTNKKIQKYIKKNNEKELKKPLFPFRLYIQEFPIADFQLLNDLHSYVYFHVSSISNNHSWDSYHVKELHIEKYGLFKNKERIIETAIDWNTVNYWLDNGMVK